MLDIEIGGCYIYRTDESRLKHGNGNYSGEILEWYRFDKRSGSFDCTLTRE